MRNKERSRADISSSTELTLFAKSNGILGKRIFLDAESNVVPDGSACKMARGTAQRITVDGPDALAKLISGLRPNQALALGRLRDDVPDRVHVVRRVDLTDDIKHNTIARTTDSLRFAPGEPGWLLLDVDLKGIPENVTKSLKKLAGLGAR
jgi:hypothetical protein